MLLRLCFLAALISGPALAQEKGTPTKDDGPALFRVTAERADDQSRDATGFVGPGGGIVTTLGAIEGAKSVHVIDRAGRSFTATGVADYNRFTNLALLAIDWGGPAPTRAQIGEAPTKGARLEIRSLVSEPVPATVLEPCHENVFMVTSPQRISFGLAGAPIVGESGVVVGALSGTHQAPPSGDDREKGGAPGWLDGTRPELIAALRMGEPIGWDHWGQRVTDMDRAARLSMRATGSAREHADGAMADAQEAVKLDDRCWQAWRMLASLRLHEGDLDGALDATEHASKLVPTDSFGYTIRSTVLALRGKYDEAVGAAKEAVRLAPEDPGAHLAVGFASQYAGRLDEAAAAYQKVLKISPEGYYGDYARRELSRLDQYGAAGEGTPTPSPRF